MRQNVTKPARGRLQLVAIFLFIGLLFGGKHLAVGGIELYQRYISPYKGYRCAYGVHVGGPSCSEYGKRAISDNGVMVGTVLLFRRFQECGQAAMRARNNPVRAGECSDCADSAMCWSIICCDMAEDKLGN